jgi:hypothetical protein
VPHLPQASSSWWRSHASGDPARDWPLLQRFSCDEPEAFWSAWLQQSRIPFATPPTRILQAHDDPDQVSAAAAVCLFHPMDCL